MGPKTSDADEAFLNLSVLETKERFYDDYVGSFGKCASLLDERLKRVLCSSLTTFVNFWLMICYVVGEGGEGGIGGQSLPPPVILCPFNSRLPPLNMLHPSSGY